MRIAYLFRAARSSYNQTTLISRSTVLNSGSPVYISAFSRFASAAAKQSAKDIFFTTFNSPATSDNSWSAGTIFRGRPSNPRSDPKPFRKTNFSFYDVANFGPIRRRNHKIGEFNPSMLFRTFIDEQL